MVKSLLIVMACLGMLMYASGVAWAADQAQDRVQLQDQQQLQLQDGSCCTLQCEPDENAWFWNYVWEWLAGGPHSQYDE